jgi:hypothetical protein
LTRVSPALTTADRALLRAITAWGWPNHDALRFWERFDPAWRHRLEPAGNSAGDPGLAIEDLRDEHAAEARADLGRVHPSWWIRALQDESPAVRRVAVIHAPEGAREALRSAFKLDEADLSGEPKPHAEILACALSLWPERLVGGLAERDDDPPVVVALTRPDTVSLRRLLGLVDLAKRSCVPESTEQASLSPRDRECLEHFRAGWVDLDPKRVQAARHDLAGPEGADPSRLALVTVGRLLSVVEPHRVRWALQHLPYQAAKYTRLRMTQAMPGLSGDELVAWESRILEAARARLDAEREQGEAGVLGGDGE